MKDTRSRKVEPEEKPELKHELEEGEKGEDQLHETDVPDQLDQSDHFLVFCLHSKQSNLLLCNRSWRVA
jgi:hypothetical protein